MYPELSTSDKVCSGDKEDGWKVSKFGRVPAVVLCIKIRETRI